ncbi:hypothetical protein NIES593_07100 [Hydrococcus rivularis NIES-593]|uniref:Uncharacterized protein n=2 Tax=Hydrococcus TaxID=1616833 RepID=A0A1U7HLG4_9CYAN|nr:hypothetical protein NIES593_07100 [Hydrococcus rivularis NIES-593]
MYNPPSSQAFVWEVAKVSRSDRWLVYHRLQELNIPCWCPSNGSLLVEVNNCIDAILLRSTVQQLFAARRELVDWLQRCWEAEEILNSEGYPINY